MNITQLLKDEDNIDCFELQMKRDKVNVVQPYLVSPMSHTQGYEALIYKEKFARTLRRTVMF